VRTLDLASIVKTQRHFNRAYATIKYGARHADESLKNMGYVLHCFKCFHREGVKGLFAVQQTVKCGECGQRLSVAGPLWLGRMLNAEFCESMKKEVERRELKLGGKIGKMLTLITSEVDTSISYYVVDKLCDSLSLPVPPVKKVVEALRKEGYEASLTYFDPRGVRSTAPALKIREILQELTSGEL
jgi:tRNA (guanine26-N2/guanine27-N2)-dimethyltransferase